ncbi:MAG: glycosyltransferase family 4 protein [Anaerolineales bacterium]
MGKTTGMKHHCMIVHAYYPLGETRVEREALALIDAGYAVDVICLRDEDERSFESINDVEIYRLPVMRKNVGGFFGQFLEYISFFALVFFKLIALYPRRNYGTVQAHNLPDFLIFSALIPKLFGARLILDLHDLMPEFFASKTNRSMDSFLVRLVILQEQLSCRFADQVVTVTEIWRERLISRGTRADKVSVVMNVADDRIFHSNSSEEHGLRENHGFRLIYHGTFKQHYGMAELIRAVKLASNEVRGLHLTLQGVGEYHAEMVRMVDELELHQYVQINAFSLPTEELPALIKKADAGVVPNHNDVFTGDLLPTKMLEYIALDVPVIAAKTRVISQYFDEKMVQFFTPGDPESLAQNIIYLSNHRDRLTEQILNSKKFTEDYSWRSVSRKYVELIKGLSGKG